MKIFIKKLFKWLGILVLIVIIIVTGFIFNEHRKAQEKPLPKCPSDSSEKWHNCFGSINEDGIKYIGEFKDNIMHGQGTLIDEISESKYIGEFKDGEMTGQGTFTSANGNYVGEFKDGEVHGYGTFTYGNGSKHVGEFKENKKHGQGTKTDVNGTIESGYYMNDEYIPSICENMGLTKGTESFGDCVLKLIDKVNEDD